MLLNAGALRHSQGTQIKDRAPWSGQNKAISIRWKICWKKEISRQLQTPLLLQKWFITLSIILWYMICSSYCRSASGASGFSLLCAKFLLLFFDIIHDFHKRGFMICIDLQASGIRSVQYLSIAGLRVWWPPRSDFDHCIQRTGNSLIGTELFWRYSSSWYFSAMWCSSILGTIWALIEGCSLLVCSLLGAMTKFRRYGFDLIAHLSTCLKETSKGQKIMKPYFGGDLSTNDGDSLSSKIGRSDSLMLMRGLCSISVKR